MTGRVFLVGAGPGAPDLLTVRAVRVLEQADIVFHDALVHPETLAIAARAQKVAVGKRSGRFSTAQRFINKRLVDAARVHQVVVRLKGGDPMLFGRAHEEIYCLQKEGIVVEVVPGVTAAAAASAELGVSLTQRGVSRSVVFATTRSAEGAPLSNWAAAVATADTAVLYMALQHAAHVTETLLRLGVGAHKPVAIVENASLNAVKVKGTLGELAALAAHCGDGPAVLLLGDVFAAAQAAAIDTRDPRTASHSA